MKKKFVLIIALTFLVTLLAVAPVSAGAIVTREEETVIDFDNVFDPTDDACPNSGVESIHVQGSYIIKTTTVVDENGGVHYSSRWNWVNFTGTGLTSGDTYVVTQVISHTEHGFVDEDDLRNYTFNFSFRLVSKGSGENIQLKGVNHYTVNPNGELTVDKATFRAVCK